MQTENPDQAMVSAVVKATRVARGIELVCCLWCLGDLVWLLSTQRAVAYMPFAAAIDGCFVVYWARKLVMNIVVIERTVREKL